MEIQNKFCLITGSAMRVGKSIALKLASKGANIAIHYNKQKREAIKTANEIKNLGRQCIILQGDISRRVDWIRMKKDLLEKWGRIDILVNNAAIFFKTPFLEITENDWNKFIDVNLKGTFLGCQIMGEQMYIQKSGKIINIADVSAYSIWTSYIPYCVSKAGVIALTKGLAKALAPYVMVNAVSPGTVMLAENYDEEEENKLMEKTPMKRIGDPEDIANSVTFLIEGSDFITGTIIDVDGGRSLT